MATPLLVVSEIMLCVHLEDQYGTLFNLMWKTLMPGDEETMSDESIWKTLPVSWFFSICM
ncbi:hypothetical protein YC2023_037232 [Brassica napus]